MRDEAYEQLLQAERQAEKAWQVYQDAVDCEIAQGRESLSWRIQELRTAWEQAERLVKAIKISGVLLDGAGDGLAASYPMTAPTTIVEMEKFL